MEMLFSVPAKFQGPTSQSLIHAGISLAVQQVSENAPKDAVVSYKAEQIDSTFQLTIHRHRTRHADRQRFRCFDAAFEEVWAEIV
jgi:hypothetical protein